MVAKTSQAHALLSKDIKQVERVYHCLVEGILEGEGVIDRPILKSNDSIKRIVDDHSKYAKTYYKSLMHKIKHFVECKLVAGKNPSELGTYGFYWSPFSGNAFMGQMKITYFIWIVLKLVLFILLPIRKYIIKGELISKWHELKI